MYEMLIELWRKRLGDQGMDNNESRIYVARILAVLPANPKTLHQYFKRYWMFCDWAHHRSEQALKTWDSTVRIFIEWLWFLHDGQEGGPIRSPSYSWGASFILDAIRVASCQSPIFRTNTTVNFITKGHAKKWDSAHAKPRDVVNIEDVERVLDGLGLKEKNRDLKEEFLTLVWCFGLRHAEVRSVQPEHIKFEKIQNKKCVTVTIVNPKIKKRSKIQHVRIDRSSVSNEMWTTLTRFAGRPENKTIDWGKVWSERVVLARIREILGESFLGIATVHGMRHGRITQLVKSFGLPEHEVMAFGRWVSRNCYLRYNHF
jgi:hypothetical protein